MEPQLRAWELTPDINVATIVWREIPTYNVNFIVFQVSLILIQYLCIGAPLGC